MQPATGFQIAFLAFAVAFFSMLVSKLGGNALGLSGGAIELLAQSVSFASAALILFGVSPLRRACVDELGRKLRQVTLRELTLVALAKCAIPSAILGATVAFAFVTGTVASLVWTGPDPADAWCRAFTARELFRVLVLSWFVGPVIEELVFRGFLYRAWERQWGPVSSLLLTSACFGLVHPSSLASTFLGSVVYICVLRRTGTLRGPILVHMLYNILISWPVLGHLLFAPPVGSPSRLATWSLPLTCLAIVMLALPAYLWMSRRDVRMVTS